MTDPFSIAAAAYFLIGLLAGAWAWHYYTSPSVIDGLTRDVPELRAIPDTLATKVFYTVVLILSAAVVAFWPALLAWNAAGAIKNRIR